MAERIPETLQKKITDRLGFYEDLGIRLFYRDRGAGVASESEPRSEVPATAQFSTSELQKEETLPKPAGKLALQKPAFQKTVPIVPPASPRIAPLPVAAGPSLFEAVDKIVDDTLLKVREDLGECTRCKLHSTRHKIVFGDGNPKAELVFVGEGPGADEDAQGLPFVGRAGKLLTQMIEAMGLQRKDVYICNVVKCRPPENRQPEEDEVSTCSPFLLRQIDVIAPKVIVCLGAVAAKTLLQTNRGISQFRGEWLEFRGRKLLATYHPAYLLRNPPAKSEVWKDLQKVMAVLGLEVKKGKSA
jgi:DNA polymerase